MDWTGTAAVAWDHVTIVNVIFTIASVANAFTAGMAWMQSRRNAKIATANNVAIGENTSATRAVEKNVNGHLAALTNELVDTKAQLAAVNGKA